MKRKIVTSKEIGERIKCRRRELEISQERLAEMLNVSYQQVQRYENGANKLNVENIQLIADLLAVPVTSFYSAATPSAIAEAETEYSSPDEKKLLKFFRKITNRRDREIVTKVVRMAAEKA
jgi:transcriptional regulator with XRE-family HTH domain